MNSDRSRCEAPATQYRAAVEAEAKHILAARRGEPLEVALAAQRPIPASNAEECTEVERLLDEDKRRITVDDHLAFREAIARPCDRFDEIDEAAADPIHDHRPASAPRHKVNRVLTILDELDRNSNKEDSNT